MRLVFHKHKHRKGWGLRIYAGRRFVEIDWFHYDPKSSYVGP